MIRHLVAWNYADGLSEEEKRTAGANMKKELESLKDLIDGVVALEVLLNSLDTSDAELLLDSTFTDEEAYKAYVVHPEHVRVGSYFVKPFTKNRKCIDFTI